MFETEDSPVIKDLTDSFFYIITLKGANTQGTPVRSYIVIGTYPSADLVSTAPPPAKGLFKIQYQAWDNGGCLHSNYQWTLWQWEIEYVWEKRGKEKEEFYGN